MNTYLLYGVIAVLLFVVEVVYFRVAACFNIIDKPNERSSHSTVVLRGGGIFFAGAVDLGRVFRVSVFVVLGGGDAGGGCQFCG